VLPSDPRSLEGTLVIEQAVAGAWGLTVHNGDTSSHMDAADAEPVNVQLVIVGREVFYYRAQNLKPAESFNVRAVKGPGVNLAALQVD
jgi:hypothetical protein